MQQYEVEDIVPFNTGILALYGDTILKYIDVIDRSTSFIGNALGISTSGALLGKNGISVPYIHGKKWRFDTYSIEPVEFKGPPVIPLWDLCDKKYLARTGLVAYMILGERSAKYCRINTMSEGITIENYYLTCWYGLYITDFSRSPIDGAINSYNIDGFNLPWVPFGYNGILRRPGTYDIIIEDIDNTLSMFSMTSSYNGRRTLIKLPEQPHTLAMKNPHEGICHGKNIYSFDLRSGHTRRIGKSVHVCDTEGGISLGDRTSRNTVVYTDAFYADLCSMCRGALNIII